MKVSHNDLEARVVALGAEGDAEAVTVATDSEFMMMMAHGIYSNKYLAFVRETICNGLDGHKAKNTPDAYLDIRVENNLYVLRDYGTGIPDDIFTSTYMTFGKSTKRDDANATGGYGLGTKVPWAICDVFTVRNFYNGTMTAYRIMKSDPALDGEPSCTPFLSVPSDEPSGVEVSVPLSEVEEHEVMSWVRRFANDLQVNVRLNGYALSNAGYNYIKAKLYSNSYAYLTGAIQSTIKASSIYLRLGDVIYPVDIQEGFEEEFKLVCKLVGRTRLLLRAAPGAVIPTLSRESLQYTKRTIQSIKDLLIKFLKDMAEDVNKFTLEILNEQLNHYVSSDLFFSTAFAKRGKDSSLLSAFSSNFNHTITPYGDIRKAIIHENLRSILQRSRPYLVTDQTNEAMLEDIAKKKLTSAFQKQLDASPIYRKDNLSKFMTASSVPSLIYYEVDDRLNNLKKMIKTKDILDVFVLFHRENYRFRTISSYIKSISTFVKDDLIVSESIVPRKLVENLYLKKILILSTDPSKVMDRAEVFLEGQPNWKSDDMSNVTKLGALYGAVYVRLRTAIKPEALEEYKKLFERQGYLVVDLMTPTSEEEEERKALAERRKEFREVQEDLNLFEFAKDLIPAYDGKRPKNLRAYAHLRNNPSYKGKSLYLIADRGKVLPRGLFGNPSLVKDLIRLVGNDIEVVSTKAEIERAHKEGRSNLDDELLAVLKRFYKDRSNWEKLYYQNTIFTRVDKYDRLYAKMLFGFNVPVFTQKEEQWLNNMRNIATFFPKSSSYVNERNRFFLKACSPNTYYLLKISRYEQDMFCNVKDVMSVALSQSKTPRAKLARSILKQIIKEDQK